MTRAELIELIESANRRVPERARIEILGQPGDYLALISTGETIAREGSLQALWEALHDHYREHGCYL